MQVASKRLVVARSTVDHGHGPVPAALYDVVTVTRDNLLDTVVRDGNERKVSVKVVDLEAR